MISPPVQQPDNFAARRQPARKSNTEHSAISYDIVREPPTTKPKVTHSRDPEAEHITITFKTSSLTSTSDFELSQESRDRASLINRRFAVDRTGSEQIASTTPSGEHRSNVPRNVTPHELMDIHEHSSPQADVPHISVNELLEEIPAAQNSEAVGSRPAATDVKDPQYPQILVDLQKA
jgi:hypothetical protein